MERVLGSGCSRTPTPLLLVSRIGGVVLRCCFGSCMLSYLLSLLINVHGVQRFASILYILITYIFIMSKTIHSTLLVIDNDPAFRYFILINPHLL
jgi:hypothetical protein